MFDRRLFHRRRRFLMSRLQRGTHFLFELGNGAECHGNFEHRFDDFFHATFTQAAIANQIRHQRSQTRTNTMGADGGGDHGARHLAAAWAGARVPLVLDDVRLDLREFRDLKSRGLWIVRATLSR